MVTWPENIEQRSPPDDRAARRLARPEQGAGVETRPRQLVGAMEIGPARVIDVLRGCCIDVLGRADEHASDLVERCVGRARDVGPYAISAFGSASSTAFS
ncbi:MAG: hypothetical protein IPM29_05980 [Planctomycetes bacterium]|nr:hypothetical protein [Planctomycetota bacterium]